MPQRNGRLAGHKSYDEASKVWPFHLTTQTFTQPLYKRRRAYQVKK